MNSLILSHTFNLIYNTGSSGDTVPNSVSFLSSYSYSAFLSSYSYSVSTNTLSYVCVSSTDTIPNPNSYCYCVAYSASNNNNLANYSYSVSNNIFNTFSYVSSTNERSNCC